MELSELVERIQRWKERISPGGSPADGYGESYSQAERIDTGLISQGGEADILESDMVEEVLEDDFVEEEITGVSPMEDEEE